MRTLVAAVAASALLCACHWWHHEEKGENDFVKEAEAADPGHQVQSRTAAAVSIEIGVVMAEMPRDLATEIFGKADWNGMTLSPNAAPDIDALARAHAAVVLISRPKLQARSGVATEVTSTNRVEYVQDYEAGQNGDFRPVQGVVEEGVWIAATPTLDTTLELLDLEYSIKRTVLERPIAEKSVVIEGTDRRVTVALPVASSMRASGHKRLLSGQTVAVAASSMDSADSKPESNPKAGPNAKPNADQRVTVALITVNFWNP